MQLQTDRTEIMPVSFKSLMAVACFVVATLLAGGIAVAAPDWIPDHIQTGPP